MKATVALSAVLFAATMYSVESMADAQPVDKSTIVRRIVVLSSGESTKSDHPLIVGLREGLKQAGYIEGNNLFLSVPRNETYDDLQSTASRLKHDTVDVVVTIGSTDTAVAKQAGLTAPMVFMPTRDPLGRGLVKSLARPETNFTGIAYETNIAVEGKGLEIFKEIIPNLQRVFIIYEGSLEKPVFSQSLPVLRKVAKHLGLNLTEKSVRSHEKAQKAVSALSTEITDGIFVICTNFFTGDPQTPRIARKKKIPFYGCPSQIRKFGGLVSYAPDFLYIGRRGAWYVDRILKGVKPQDLPVETATKFELALNLNTADAIGIKIPTEVLQRADKVFR